MQRSHFYSSYEFLCASIAALQLSTRPVIQRSRVWMHSEAGIFLLLLMFMLLRDERLRITNTIGCLVGGIRFKFALMYFYHFMFIFLYEEHVIHYLTWPYFCLLFCFRGSFEKSTQGSVQKLAPADSVRLRWAHRWLHVLPSLALLHRGGDGQRPLRLWNRTGQCLVVTFCRLLISCLVACLRSACCKSRKTLV